ncbi:hypothetical protein [Yoonia sp. I 8.24]|uniref:hypothetical protein n=1 Tax=Yoonia sp. I 8.24 TaxID=1537229 RepID=UPI001EDD93D5|nr:hypothetical protein [Yoonia sp. I 8.24]MCG3268376.1 hypothetical protein [Yoonia sp. I 8.24]
MLSQLLKAEMAERGHIRKSLVVGLPDVALDLIEIAAFVYAIDSSVSRGGLMDQQMGAKWHRRFHVSLPVWRMPFETLAKSCGGHAYCAQKYEYLSVELQRPADTPEQTKAL